VSARVNGSEKCVLCSARLTLANYGANRQQNNTYNRLDLDVMAGNINKSGQISERPGQ
jgi:hypothetical protein